jgi:FKBP-type peptidyl-prolyl isomerase-like protein
VIRGWDEGLLGMRAGGRRLVILQPRYAYGDAGSPPAIKPGETLVFVVDALRVRHDRCHAGCRTYHSTKRRHRPAASNSSSNRFEKIVPLR